MWATAYSSEYSEIVYISYIHNTHYSSFNGRMNANVSWSVEYFISITNFIYNDYKGV